MDEAYSNVSRAKANQVQNGVSRVLKWKSNSFLTSSCLFVFPFFLYRQPAIYQASKRVITSWNVGRQVRKQEPGGVWMGFCSGKWAVNYVRCSMGSGRYVIQYGRFYVRCSMCMAGAMLGM